MKYINGFKLIILLSSPCLLVMVCSEKNKELNKQRYERYIYIRQVKCDSLNDYHYITLEQWSDSMKVIKNTPYVDSVDYPDLPFPYYSYPNL